MAGTVNGPEKEIQKNLHKKNLRIKKLSGLKQIFLKLFFLKMIVPRGMSSDSE
jgi:hypothetical protein